MCKKDIKLIVDKIYMEIKSKRAKSKATKKELTILVNCGLIGDFTPMFTTKLYNLYGGEYCEILEIKNRILKGGKSQW